MKSKIAKFPFALTFISVLGFFLSGGALHLAHQDVFGPSLDVQVLASTVGSSVAS
jgi:hypothetical protein